MIPTFWFTYPIHIQFISYSSHICTVFVHARSIKWEAFWSAVPRCRPSSTSLGPGVHVGQHGHITGGHIYLHSTIIDNFDNGVHTNIYIYICVYVYIYTLGAPGFRKGWGGVGHVSVMFMLSWCYVDGRGGAGWGMLTSCSCYGGVGWGPGVV